MDCIFCKIVNGQMGSHTVFEDSETLAFLDIFGATDGHTMVIPKKHGETILEFTPADLQAVWTTGKKVAAALQKTYNTTILSIGINHGEPQGVKHLHVHFLPRFEGDGGGIIQSLPGKKLSDNDFATVAKKIKKNIE